MLLLLDNVRTFAHEGPTLSPNGGPVKATKFIVLACGVLGIVAFFLPLVHVKEVNAKVSAFQVVKGLDTFKDEVAKNKDKVADAVEKTGAGKMSGRDVKELAGGANDAANAIKFIMYGVFAPSIFFLLFGGIGAAGRFGRGLSIATFVFGLLGVGIWALMQAGAKETGVTDALGTGFYALAGAYFGGTAASLFGIIKPEQKAVAA